MNSFDVQAVKALAHRIGIAIGTGPSGIAIMACIDVAVRILTVSEQLTIPEALEKLSDVLAQMATAEKNAAEATRHKDPS